MSTPINLNKARKARAKVKKRAQADANAVKFGAPKTERAQQKAQEARAAKTLDGHKRDRE